MVVKPPARLTHRQRQALETRRLIVDSARALFLDSGYAATTIEAIAARAGVAVSTVYAAFSNKRGILTAIRQAWHEQSGQRELYAQADAEPDPARKLELAARATRRQWETGAEMTAVYTGAAAVDAEAAEELRLALGGRRTNLGVLARRWAAQFRPGLDPDQAAAILLALTRSEVYAELVQAWGWTPDDYEAWLAGTLKAQFLA